MGHFKLLLKKPHENRKQRKLIDNFDFYSRGIGFYLEDHPALTDVLQSVDEFEEFAPELFSRGP